MAQTKRDRLRRGAQNNFSTPHLKPAPPGVSEQGDPLQPLTVTLTLDELTVYDRNPRQSENDAWDSIVRETRALKGLDGVLAVTRRPGETLYFPKRGGNTRLRVLKQLWEETGDERYYRVDCKVYPWRSEADVLTAHLSDNDNRGGVSFIDRARGIRALKRELEKELGASLSQRELARQLTERGYAISHSLLASMDYALDTLLPLTPCAFEAGMGRPKVVELRKLQNHLRDHWLKRNPDAVPYENLFAQVLSQHDDDALDMAVIEQALKTRIAEELNRIVITETPSTQEGLAAHGHSGENQSNQPLSGSDERETSDVKTANSGNENRSTVNSVHTGANRITNNPEPPGNKPEQTHTGRDYIAPPLTENASDLSALLQPARDNASIDTLRHQNFTLARTACAHTEIRKYIYPVDYAYGFVMDVPYRFLDPRTVAPEEQTAMRTAQYLYHHLLALAENQTSIDVVRAMPFHSETVKYVKPGAAHFNAKLRQFAPPPRQALAGACLFNAEGYLPDEQLLALFQIVLNNRAIRRLSEDPWGASLYPAPPSDEQLGLDPAQFPELFQTGGER